MINNRQNNILQYIFMHLMTNISAVGVSRLSLALGIHNTSQISALKQAVWEKKTNYVKNRDCD